MFAARVGCAIDGATGKVWFSQNGTYFGKPLGHNSGAGATGDPAAGTNEIGTITNGTTEDVFFVIGGNTSVSSIFVNFGQDSQNVSSAQSDGEGIGTFEYAPPTDYLALCASNLSDPTIGPAQSTQADDHFNTVLYTGDADNDVTATNTFAADWVWLKNRTDSSTNHYLQDSVRGFGNSKSLSSNTNGAQGYNGGAPSSHNIVTGSTSLRLVSSDLATNAKNFVAWTWKSGGSADTFNVDGTGHSSMSNASLSDGTQALTGLSVDTTSKFSIATFTMPDAQKTVAHGLGVKPDWVIFKNLSTGNWQIWHNSFGENTEDVILLDTTAGTAQAGGAANWFQAVSTTLITLQSAGAYFGTGDYVMYSFANVEGFSKFDTFIGNGAADGAFVHTGFRPAWVMIKRSSGSGGWHMFDNKRSTFNEIDVRIEADNTDAENTSGPPHMDFLSNGFKMRTTFDNMNASGSTYIYLAFAEAPFKFANSR